MLYKRMTVAQAVVHFLDKQYVEFDGKRYKFFQGMWGIFGHGNVGGLGQALEEYPEFPYYQARNEQGMVHASVAYAKQKRRLSTFACTSSIGPGATNMITAAAGATINRLPVLLLPGDIFARRQKGPVLQQLEHPMSLDLSVNDCFRPVSKFWDRIYRWEQLEESLRESMRVLTSPVETGAVTICLPQDVQAETGAFPNSIFEETLYTIRRRLPEEGVLKELADLLSQSQRPLLIAGGGLVYSQAEELLEQFCTVTKIPCVETQAGKASLSYRHEQSLGALGVTGTQCANRIAAKADLILAVGTRLGDFATASGTQFANPNVKFASINVDEKDAHKYSSFPVLGDGKVSLELLLKILQERKYQASPFYQEECHSERKAWFQVREALFQEGVEGDSSLSDFAKASSDKLFTASSDKLFTASSDKLFTASSDKLFTASSDKLFTASSDKLFTPSSDKLFTASSDKLFTASSDKLFTACPTKPWRSRKGESKGSEWNQIQILNLLNQNLKKEDTVLCAAGSLPGDMHKLLHLEKSSQYHMEYGYSCMGYEIAGGLGAKMAKEEGELFVLVGDGSYLMMHSELLTSLQESQKIIVVLFVNGAFACIDGLSKKLGSEGFGNRFQYREGTQLSGETLSIDYLANAQSYGVEGFRVSNAEEFEKALSQSRLSEKTCILVCEVSPSSIPSYESRWNVPVAESSRSEKVHRARKAYEDAFLGER